MANNTQLSELLVRWLELQDQGQNPSAADLCAGCPELADELRQRMQALKGMQSFLGMTPSAGIPAPGAEDLTATAPADAPKTPAMPDADPGAIPSYEVLGELGRGGMGVVYRAIQKATKRTVALKVMLHGRHAAPRQRLRFEREVDLVAGLRHPHIVTVYDSGSTADGLPYFVMEYIEGMTLDAYLSDGPPKPVGELSGLLRLFIAICDAVNYAHQHGVIHRDLKPANIRIDAAGAPHILDFGLAKAVEAEPGEPGATRTGEFLGTLAYASPEQARGDTSLIDTRTDVYSLGVILYQMLTGGSPYGPFDNFAAALHAILLVEPTPPSERAKQVGAFKIDDQLDAVVLKALAKEREERYQSAGALADDLRHYLAGEPIQARPPGLGLLLRMWFRQHARAALWTIGVGLVCGGLSAGLIGLPRLLPFLRYCAISYARFPSLPRPWLALSITLPEWAVLLLTVLGAIAFVGMGLFTALLVRPKRRSDDTIAGAATGLVGGVTAFIISGGWATVLAVAVFPSVGDITLLGERNPARSAPEPAAGPDDPLVERFPDLRPVPEAERGTVTYNKIVADIVVGIPVGIWLGILFTVGTYAASGVYGTIVAGALLRREARLGAVVVPYLEATIPGAWLIFVLFMQAFFHRGHWPNTDVSGWWIVLLFLVLAVIAAAGFLRQWPWPLRVALYAAWAVTLVRVAAGAWPWYADGLVYGLALGVIVWHFLRSRRRARVGSTALQPPYEHSV